MAEAGEIWRGQPRARDPVLIGTFVLAPGTHEFDRPWRNHRSRSMDHRIVKSVAVRHGTANRFGDHSFADADADLRKAELVCRLQRQIDTHKLTHVQAAKLTGVSQPDLFRVLRGRLRASPVLMA